MTNPAAAPSTHTPRDLPAASGGCAAPCSSQWAAAVPIAEWVPPQLLELLKAVDVNRFWNVVGCGRRFYRASCCNGHRHVIPRTCGDRLCPHCERRRAARAVKRYAPIFRGRQWVRFITLTVRRHRLGELSTSLRDVRKWFRRLRQVRPELFQGGVYAVETKGKRPHRDDRGGWHTHIHALAYGPRWAFVRQDELSATWERITRGRGRIVDIRAARRDHAGSLEGSLRECLKYVTKGLVGDTVTRTPSDGWTPGMVREFYAATKHRRLFQKFGDAGPCGELEPLKCEACGEAVRPLDGHVDTLSREDAQTWLEDRGPELGRAGWADRYEWDPITGRFRPCSA